jgi:hypothetical protein
MYKKLIFIIAFFILNKGYSQDNFIKNDTIYLNGKNIGFIQEFKTNKSNLDGVELRHFTLLITQPIDKYETSLVENLLGKTNEYYVFEFEYKYDFSKVEKSKMAGYYLIEASNCKNTSTTLGLIGAVGGSVIIYFSYPIGIGVAAVCTIISIVKNYQGNNYLKKAGELLIK